MTQWIQPFEIRRTDPWNQQITGEGVRETALKVAKAFFMTLFEGLRNGFLSAANFAISIVNRTHDCFAGRRIAPPSIPIEIAPPPPPPLELEIDGLVGITRNVRRQKPVIELLFQSNAKTEQFYNPFFDRHSQGLILYPDGKVMGPLLIGGRLPDKTLWFVGEAPDANHADMLDALRSAILRVRQ